MTMQTEEETTFSQGWDEAMRDGAPQAAAESEQTSQPAGEAPAGEAPAGEQPAGEAPAGEAPAGEQPAGEQPAGEQPAGEQPAGEQPAAEQPPQKDSMQDVLDRLRQIDERLTPPADNQPEAAKPAEPPLYTPEEETQLAAFKSEWPEVAAGVELLLRQARAETLKAVTSTLDPVLQPVVQTVRQTEAERHYAAIVAAHPDYPQLYENIVGWIDKQPAYVKNAYLQVAQNGSSADVVDLITRFKQGSKPAEPAKVAATAPTTKPPADLPADAKQAASSLAVVASQRSVAPKAIDKDDFDSAWAEAIRSDA